MKILLVEDDLPTATILSEVLTAEHYTVEVAADGQNGLALATVSNFDLILLDLLIPKLDGINLCRQLRAQGIQKPILLLTAKDQSADVVKGLDAGADDYVIKPYDISELLARIRALLRRGTTQLRPSVLSWGNLCFNIVSAEVTYEGKPISLSPKEYSLLRLFLRNPQRVFSRSDIIDHLWSVDATPSEGAVTNLIKDLRHKLKTIGMSAELLETVYGLGYRLKPPPTPDSEQEQAKSQKAIAAINKTIERYKDTFAQRLTLLEQAELALYAGELLPQIRQQASNEAHKLAGTLGSFGYEIGSKLAQAIEHLLVKEQDLTLEDAVKLSQLISQLKGIISRPPKPLTVEQIEPKGFPLVLAMADESFANELKMQAASWGVRIEVAANLENIPQNISPSPKVILFNLNGQKSSQKSLKLLAKLKQKFPNTSIIVVANQDNLAQRVAVARLGIQGFLSQPTITKVFQAITKVIPQSQASPAKVMIVDDDPVMLDILSNVLQPWGLTVKTLQNPQKFWESLIKITPDLLMIDLEMPIYSGIDLCRVVRQDAYWGNLPILVVTAHTDNKTIQQVFAAGADDFIGKPVEGKELITRVISRINRSRVQEILKT
ncbi:response regulator [Nostoc sp. FACHB-152]|uniref:response regulator n=1 Tax=unclassified Nostoc TaxID=2593658 RepID=UPI0016850245|nr:MULTISPECIES: response regulator [unclassified Nostoc]MBD2447138.1 response regulator [Nostoc sp. FACHB-152]MBD2469184.1 response regulator [Nostoc sp. FACHB-145]